MADIIFSRASKKASVEEGDEIRQACEELGVPFGCFDGHCGTCMIDILDGEENLSELTEKEMELDRDEKSRLACQCRIKGGSVKIDF